MKNIVVNDEYNQTDLKPTALLEQYISSLHKDVLALLAQPSLLKARVCPGCGSSKALRTFERSGFLYKECADCASLYVDPRPSDEQINRFYRQAPSKIFWRNQLSEVSRGQRKEKIIKPRFEWVLDSAAEHLPSAKHWVDVHTGQKRYLEGMARTSFKQKTVIYPYCDTPSLQGVTLVDKPWWETDIHQTADVITLFEVLDHTGDVAGLFTKMRHMLSPGGLCFMTAILASGFDIKELGPHAKNIYPPDRLNVFSVKGLKALIERHGFECLEFSTPGILDVNIVAEAFKENPAIATSAFIRSLALEAGEETKRAFQEFLQANLLSSYGRILIRKN